MENLVSVATAARSTGKHSRTLRYWISNGKLPATRGKGGMLVSLDDVRRIAALTGNAQGKDNEQNSSTENLSMEMSERLSQFSPSIVERESSVSIIIRETLTPFIIELKEAHEEIGRLRTLLDTEYERRISLETVVEALKTHEKTDEEEFPLSNPKEPLKGVETPSEPSLQGGWWAKLKTIFAR